LFVFLGLKILRRTKIMLKRSILSVAFLMLAVALVAPAASAQTTLDVQNGVVVGVWDNTLVIRDSAGVSRQFDVPPDFRVDVDGKATPIKDLRPGMKITAAIKTTTNPIVVQSKELRNAQYIRHDGGIVYVEEGDGIHAYNTPAGFRFWIGGAPLRPDDLQSKTRLNATIVHTGTGTGTTQELAGASATDEAAKAAAARAAADKAAADRAAAAKAAADKAAADKAAADAAAARAAADAKARADAEAAAAKAAADAAAAQEAMAESLPKTGSSVPLAGALGLLCLGLGATLTLRRKI
jgi:LPXTG-motif cell wall-anchored protein